ncbi:RDD family protein [Cellulomonas chitinilytica]|uniref:RDD family protein n=2 Tax=Cellulomonas chitinilytica TaxID=398759 RepID=A0A919TZV8_9CELL|nr:RDD family protein [Cellulomonas chitinilytica]
MGSWLEGEAPSSGRTHRGARLGLPPDGPGSLARLGRRVAALAIDWVACLAIAAAFFPAAGASGFFLSRGEPMATLGVFALENVLLVGTVGNTLGHRILGLHVRRVVLPPAADAPVVPPHLLAALVRTALLCLVVPAVVWDGDGRGLHDRVAGTAIVRR